MMIGGMLMTIAACLVMTITLIGTNAITMTVLMMQPWIFLLGAVCFVTMQRLQTYNGANIAIHRLRSIQLLSGICFILAGILMIENYYHWVQPLVVSDIKSYYTYLQVVHNNWVVTVLVGAVLQMYTAHRIASELKKES